MSGSSGKTGCLLPKGEWNSKRERVKAHYYVIEQLHAR